MSGTLYAVGLGPGDPDLMTVRARRVLQSCPIVVVPARSERHASYALAIVADLLDTNRQEVVTRPFPRSPDGWAELTDELVCRTERGDLAFLVEGDPLLFGSFLDVLRCLRASHPATRVEVVPGVPSALAAAATAQLPLADGARGMAILSAPVTHDQLLPLLPGCSTVALLKVAPVLTDTLQVLERLNMAENAVFARRVGRPEQTILVGAQAIREAPREVTTDYFSLLIAPTPQEVPA